MKLWLSHLLFAVASLSSNVSATTYQYTSSGYADLTNFKIPCGIGSCANYSPGGAVTGYITTASPLAPNLMSVPVVPSLTGFFFTDGINTYSSADPNTKVHSFFVDTDAGGNILLASFAITLWRSGTNPHVPGDRVSLLQQGNDIVWNNAACRTVSVSPAGVPDTCLETKLDDSTSLARASYVGAWLPAVAVVEFYNAALDHFFITWVRDEIAKLDAGVESKGWVRTGYEFKAFSIPQTGASPVCRYYIPPGLGNSHFFGRGAAECDATGQKNPSFVLEDPAFMHMFLPASGVCPTNTTQVYRVFSNRTDANHRYTIDETVRNQMVAKGWLAEGDGPNQVVMCSPQVW
jgi:hypothetical protein